MRIRLTDGNELFEEREIDNDEKLIELNRWAESCTGTNLYWIKVDPRADGKEAAK